MAALNTMNTNGSASRGSYTSACHKVCSRDVCVTFLKEVLLLASEEQHNALITVLLEVITLAQPRSTSDIEAVDRVD